MYVNFLFNLIKVSFLLIVLSYQLDSTKIMKKFNVDEENVNIDLGKKQKPNTTKKRLITISLVLGTILIIVGISLGIVFGVRKRETQVTSGPKTSVQTVTTTADTTKPDLTTPVIPPNRVNCLPWLKSNDPKIKEECSKIPYCGFESIGGSYQSCYIQNDLIKIKKTNEVETKLGRSYTIESNYGKAVSTNILLEFEELDDNTLRFKVNKLF